MSIRAAGAVSAAIVFMSITAEADPTPEIVVLASQLRDAELATVPVSVTQLDTAEIAAASLQHVEELFFF